MNAIEAREAIQRALRSATKNNGAILPLTGDLVAEKLIDSLEGMVLLMEISTITGVEFPEEDPIEQNLFDIDSLTKYLVEHSSN